MTSLRARIFSPVEEGKASAARESTYDDKQINAVSLQCVICLQWYVMTTPRAVCLRCQRTQGKAKREVER